MFHIIVILTIALQDRGYYFHCMCGETEVRIYTSYTICLEYILSFSLETTTFCPFFLMWFHTNSNLLRTFVSGLCYYF